MADIESNIKVNIDTSDALSQLKLLQQQISVFQQAMKNAGQANAQAAAQMQQNLMTTINATGKLSMLVVHPKLLENFLNLSSTQFSR
jgi:hypothetical protein